MHCVPLRRLLESQSDAQRRGFVVESAGKHNRSREARRTRETARNANRRVSGQICYQQARAAGRG